MTAVSLRLVRSVVKPRAADAHKGDHGHVLVAAGSPGMTGAAVLCVEAALRSGAGLVTAAAPVSSYDAVCARQRPEALSLALPAVSNGMPGTSAGRVIAAYAHGRRVSCVVAGPGLGRSRGTAEIVRAALEMGVPVVLDADAINTIAEMDADRRTAMLVRARGPVVLTPHSGEFARVFGRGPGLSDEQRSSAACALARRYRAVCVLKGRHTIISDGKQTIVNMNGNPGMATAGSGDVLAGIIGALAARRPAPDLFAAAAAGVYLHGSAGDKAARRLGQESMLAGDIIHSLPDAFRAVARTRP